MQHQQRQFTVEGLLERGARLEEPFEEANSAMLAAHQAEHIGIHRFHEGFDRLRDRGKVVRLVGLYATA